LAGSAASGKARWRSLELLNRGRSIISLTGGVRGAAIVLTGTAVDGSPLRCSCNDIQTNLFYRKGEISADGGKTWRVEQEVHLTRQKPPPT
jgi:hypothetical protein